MFLIHLDVVGFKLNPELYINIETLFCLNMFNTHIFGGKTFVCSIYITGQKRALTLCNKITTIKLNNKRKQKGMKFINTKEVIRQIFTTRSANCPKSKCTDQVKRIKMSLADTKRLKFLTSFRAKL